MQSRARVVCAKPARWGRVPGEREQVVALVLGEPQRAGERGGRLFGWPRAAPLLEARVEVRRHVRERSDLLAAQSASAAPRPGGQTEVARL